jgi:HK97 family phage prohead protease
MTNIERRTITNTFEVRNEGDKTTIVGYAAVFNSLSQNLGGFVEQVQPGAFKKTLQEADVRALFNHDPNIVLGRNKAGIFRGSRRRGGTQTKIGRGATPTGKKSEFFFMLVDK